MTETGRIASTPADGLRWYLDRLRAMPPREVPFRLGEQARRVLGRAAGPARTPVEVTRCDTGLGELVCGWSADPDVRAFWLARAHEVADGVVQVFGTRWPTSADGVPHWNADPATGHHWPDRYCFDVPLSAGGEPKYVWELNRLQYLLPVAAHAAVAGDSSAADLCVRHLQRWLDDNPPRRGVLWRSGIELAIRCLSMVVLLELLTRVGGRRGRLERAVARSVTEHADWIRRFPSRYSSANNHRIAELAGLILVGTAYPGAIDRTDVATSWRELDEETCRQIHPDGVPGEQSTAYGALVLEWLAIATVLGNRAGYRFSAESRGRIDAAARFLTAVTDSAGGTVRVGDDDESRLLTAARPRSQHVAAVVGLVEHALPTVVPPYPAGVSCFGSGGYTVSRSMEPGGEALWVLDHGPLGLGPLAAHAHADTLAVYLHYRGRPVFVDAGTYQYSGAGEWRGRIRSTALHNTMTIGDSDSSTMTGPFNWHPTRRAHGRLVHLASNGCGFRMEAEHDGYLDRHGVIHRRALTATGAGRFRLSDRITGARRVPASWSLLLGDGLTVRETAGGWLVSDQQTALVRLEVPADWTPRVARGLSEPKLGWYAPSFGRLVPAAQLLLDGDIDPARPLHVDITLLALTGAR